METYSSRGVSNFKEERVEGLDIQMFGEGAELSFPFYFPYI